MYRLHGTNIAACGDLVFGLFLGDIITKNKETMEEHLSQNSYLYVFVPTAAAAMLASCWYLPWPSSVSRSLLPR